MRHPTCRLPRSSWESNTWNHPNWVAARDAALQKYKHSDERKGGKRKNGKRKATNGGGGSDGAAPMDVDGGNFGGGGGSGDAVETSDAGDFGSANRDGDRSDGAAPMDVDGGDIGGGGGSGDSDVGGDGGSGDSDIGGGGGSGDSDVGGDFGGGDGSGDSDVGDFGGGDSDGSDSSDDSDCDNRTVKRKKQSGTKPPAGQARLDGPQLGRIFTTPDPEHEASDTNHIATQQRQSDTLFKERMPTVQTAARTVYGVGTIPGLAKLLRGLTDEPNDDNLSIGNGVYFDRDHVDDLKADFDLSYMLNPSHIEVTLGETTVNIPGRKLLVTSFSAGKYQLEDGTELGRRQLLEKMCDGGVTLDNHIQVTPGKTKVQMPGRKLKVTSFSAGKYQLEDGTKLGQWKLLKNRCDGGVTLDDECRRFVGHLISKWVIMMALGVPFEAGGPNMNTGMLWNIDHAIRRLRGKYVEVCDEEMDLPKLLALKERLDKRRTLMLRVFTGLTVEDTLPANFWPRDMGGEATALHQFAQEREATALHQFAQERGSMAKLNFLGGLDVKPTKTMAGGSLFTGDVVTGSFSEAPKPLTTSGAWEARLKNMIHMLTLAYRQGRPMNFLEGYIPLSRSELEIVNLHHPKCSTNLEKGCGRAYLANDFMIDATDEELVGEKAYPLRFASMRANVVLPCMVPVIIHTLGLRDSDDLGYLAPSSADTGGMCLSRTGGNLLEDILKKTPSWTAVERILAKSKKCILDKTRNNRQRWDAIINGSTGKSSKQRKCKAGLIEDEQEEREEKLDRYMRLVRVNGMMSVMNAIKEIDEGFVEWGMARLVEAESVSTLFKREHIRGYDHLFGGTSEQVEEGLRGVTVEDGRRRVDELVEKLEAAGITCRTFSIFSVGTMLAMIMSGANIRPEDFFFLETKTMYFDKKAGEDGILKIGMPIDGKQTEQADKELCDACKFHDIEGHDVVRWCMVMALVGRQMLAKKNGGKVNEMFGPLQPNGFQMSDHIFGVAFKEIGRSLFGMGNMTINTMRTVQDTIAVEFGLEFGLQKEHEAFRELARQQRTSIKVSPYFWQQFVYSVQRAK